MHKVWLKWPPTGELKESSDAPEVLVPLMARGWVQASDAEVAAGGTPQEEGPTNNG